MVGKSISFAVGSQYGPRSARWILTMDGSDAYVTNERMREDFKVSLHDSGRWHLKKLGKIAKPGEAPMLRSHESLVPVGQYRVGLFIVIPDSSLRPASDPERAMLPDCWLDRPVAHGEVEIAVMRWRPENRQEEWPGQQAGTELRIVYKLGDGSMICVLTRYIDASDPLTVAHHESIKEAIGGRTPIVLDSPERRGYAFSEGAAGSIVTIEFSID